MMVSEWVGEVFVVVVDSDSVCVFIFSQRLWR